MDSERIIALFAELLRIPVDELSSDSSPDNVDAWDSITHLELVSAVEREFDVRFDMADLVNLRSIAAFSEMIEAKRPSA